MPSPTRTDEVTLERGVSKLSRALSKLSLKTDDSPNRRRTPAKVPRPLQPNARKVLCELSLPTGLSRARTRDYIHSTCVTPNGKAFPPQYSEIIPDRLFVADRYTGTDAAILERLRITHVVCIVDAWHQDYAPLPSLHYHRLIVPNESYQACQLVAKIDDTVDFIDSALRKNGSRVLVHCLMGVHWAPSMVVAWLMRNEGCTFADALDVVRQKRQVVELGDLESDVKEWWALELARPLFPLGRGGRHPSLAPSITFPMKIADQLYEAEDEVLDIRRYP